MFKTSELIPKGWTHEACSYWQTLLAPVNHNFPPGYLVSVWFFTYNVGAVCFLPYINLFYRQLGFSEAQIGREL